MRQRIERKIRKQLRRARRWELELARRVRRYESQGAPLESALRVTMLDKGAPWLIRGSAARLLAISNSSSTVGALLHQFFGQDEKDELWDTALVLETLSDRRAVGPLAGALNDPNPHRRHAAARALGWIPQAGNRAVEALIGALTDQRQLQPVREEAAESLAYLYSRRAIPPLISVLSDSDVRIRFWAVFALGSIRSRRTSRHSDRRVVPALMSMLGDPAIPPGNWWSVAREALAMLGNLDPPEERYRRLLAEELQRVQVDPESSPADRRWAESYR